MNRHLKRLLNLCVLILIFAAVPTLWAEQSKSESDSAEPFEVGVLLCLSGNCADWGQAALDGARLAAEIANARGGLRGRQIELRVEDTAEAVSGAKTVSAFKKLQTNRNLRYFIGPSWAPGALALLPLIKEATDIVMITPSASAVEFSRAGDHVFNMRAAEEAGTKALAGYAVSQGWKRAAIFSSQQPAEMTQGRVFEKEFTKLGGTVTILLEPTPTLSDLRSEATKIIAGKPDVVFMMNYNQIDAGARELSKQGYRGARMAISLDAQRLKSAKGALNGVIVARAPEPSRAFRQRFTKRFGHPPGLSAEGGFDAIQVLLRSISEADSTDVNAVKSILPTLQYAGASGEIRFDEHGALIQRPALFRVQDEQLVGLEVH